MIILENPETGQTREIQSGESFAAPWRVKGTVNNAQRMEAHNAAMQRLTAAAADFGLPAAMFQRVGGWLLGCAKCTTTAEVTALLDRGKITADEHKDLFIRVANAIDQKDERALLELKGKLEALRRSR